MFRLLEMWQSLVSPYIPRKVADAKPLGIEVGFLTDSWLVLHNI
jgi:hypothetical protein